MLVFANPGADFSRWCAHPAARPLIFATHPLLHHNAQTALFQHCSKSNTGVYVRAFRFLVPHQPIGLCSYGREYGREISKRLTMWHMKHIHVADVSTRAAH
jgi:hypothetical protein